MNALPDTSKPVVTLWETYGAGMLEIGRLLADRLGIPLNQQEFSSEQLEAAQQRRERDGFLNRFLSSYGAYADDQLDPSGTLAVFEKDDHQRSIENTVKVKAFAEEGGVIMGHDATAILATRPNTLHVKLDGPVYARIAHAVATTHIEEAHATRRQKIEDIMRPEMSMKFHHYDPTKNDRFDLVLNTTLISHEAVVDIIMAALAAKVAQPVA